MTKKNLLLSGLALMLPLALGTLLVLHPTRAKSEDKASPLEVRVDNFTFGPETLKVPVNSTVTWVNKDDVPHVIASDDGLFKSKALDTDDKYSYTFTTAGAYPYYCSVHPKMVGKIVVQ
jgi:plastocyanin